MKIERPITFLDVEATGVDIQVDRIIELSILTFDGDKVTFDKTRRFNPGCAIPEEATKIHLIKDSDVANEPPITKAIGQGILKAVASCDLAGYNLRRFDLPILDEELRRVGLKLDLVGVRIIDVQGIYFKKDPRSLSDAVRKYCGREHEGAHSSAADNQATLDVLIAQLKEYPDLGSLDVAKLSEFSRIGDFEHIDVAGKLYRDKDGDACYAFGKQRGVKVKDDPGYADWMLNRANFPGSTQEALRAELAAIEEVPY